MPNARGYKNAEDVVRDVDYFNWPVVVKPVDSAGSKGVSRVDEPKNLPTAIAHALDQSHNGHFIVEDFLELEGYQSSADCFSVNGELVYADYSDQLFDKDAANPYTPALEIWPSTMKREHQDFLSQELQRLIKLLRCGTGLYNVESRLCKNGKPYIMEVSPRAGGNRIAELQRIGTGIDLIEAEVLKAVGEPLSSEITMPKYDGCYVNDIIHSLQAGTFQGIEYDEQFMKEHVISEAIYPAIGDHVDAFHGANNAIGSVFLKFADRKQCDEKVAKLTQYIRTKIES